MPELPDVEVYRRHLARTSLHKRIDRVGVDARRVLEMAPGTLRRHLKGKRLKTTRRHGKWLLADIDGDDRWLALHFGMTGRVHHLDAEEQAPRDARLTFAFAEGDRLVYTSRRRLGKVELVDGPQAFVAAHALGPDALGIAFEDLQEALGGKSGTIKGALMDQSALAGVGNVYADEILYQAKIHPRTKVPDLGEKDLRRLHRHMQDVFERAIRAGAAPNKMPRTWLTPHRNDPQARCPRCGTPLATAQVAGRTTRWCPQRV